MVSIAAMILAASVSSLRQSTLGEIEPRVDDPRQFVQAVLDFPDAACARHAFDRERHMRRTGIARLDEQR
jgi:hypothetical protein